MSSSDCYHPSMSYEFQFYGVTFSVYSFATEYFSEILDYHNAMDAFALAITLPFITQNPQISDNSPYSFF